ncbi:uncharacterized protein [Aquarana catesbeiana]|uniref:uncharacterized protein isoform X1 n=1 Tax=Aquarana catesbeiana TaxID=8400 RepID=UPI003CCA4337
MGPYYQWMFVLILLLPGVAVSGEPAIAVEGDTLTLNCTYSVTDKGRTSMCWGRGGCTALFTVYCNTGIIKTDGSKVTEKTSNKYQLLGNIERGDVSLTITNVTKEDEGIFCCRVEISGLFNDKKNTYNVKVREKDKSDASTESNDRDRHKGTSDLPVTEADDRTHSGNYDDDSKTFPSVNSSPTPMTPVKTNPPPSSEVQSNTRTLYILILILVLIAIAFTTVIVYRNKAKDKTPVVSAGPMTELAASGTTAEENIYTED